ncbi:MAG TPA: hypothetical protein VGJ91_22845 [Polyangiaceae bacterium]
MSATLPPAVDVDRPSDFGEFWRQAEAGPRVPSLMPEAEVRLLSLSPEQHARRLRLRRAVAGVVLGLLAFTALAACVYVVKNHSAADSSAQVALNPSAATTSEPERAHPPAAPVAEAVTPVLSDSAQALALAHDPIATAENLQTWSRLAAQLSVVDRQRAEHDLSRLSVTGARSVREAARLELALLWRVTARRAKAQKVLVSLARTAADPLVKKYALDTLASA